MGFTHTPVYSAPEQYENEIQDKRTDIYQVGVVIFELLTDKLPFECGEKIDSRLICKTSLPKPSEINPNLPKSIDPVLLKALEKRKEDRYQSITEFKRELERVLLQFD